MTRRLLVLLCVGCISLVSTASVFAAARPALTRADAENKSSTDALNKWKATLTFEEGCTGPFENVKGKTQWACYGSLSGGPQNGKFWQINLDPFGTITFERLCATKCPGHP